MQAGVFDSLTAAALMSHSPGARSRCPAPSAVKNMATFWDDQDVHDKLCGRNMFPLNPPPTFIELFEDGP